MELAVLAAGVDARRELSEQPLVVAAPAEGGVEHARVDADERRLEARIEELARERGRVSCPQSGNRPRLPAAARRLSR